MELWRGVPGWWSISRMRGSLVFMKYVAGRLCKHRDHYIRCYIFALCQSGYVNVTHRDNLTVMCRWKYLMRILSKSGNDLGMLVSVMTLLTPILTWIFHACLFVLAGLAWLCNLCCEPVLWPQGLGISRVVEMWIMWQCLQCEMKTAYGILCHFIINTPFLSSVF